MCLLFSIIIRGGGGLRPLIDNEIMCAHNYIEEGILIWFIQKFQKL